MFLIFTDHNVEAWNTLNELISAGKFQEDGVRNVEDLEVAFYSIDDVD